MRRHRNRVGGTVLLTIVLGMLLHGIAAARSAPERLQELVTVELADMSPRVITTGSSPVLKVSGRIVNVGDRSITQLWVRLQRDDPVTSDEAASQAIGGIPRAPYVTRFRAVPGTLAPGQSRPFELEVALRGGAGPDSLHINEPGVYPLLVNLNGKPDFGGLARLASVPLLLPVLGLPPAAPGGAPGPGLPRPLPPTPLTVVWPLATEPARLPTGPGEPVLLASDSSGPDPITVQIAPGGRLDGLVGALEQVVPPGSPLAAAVCVAVDPLLLETVDGMSRGYQVAHPDRISPGTGTQDARNWLDRLRGAVQGRCVLPLPYADADLVALSRAGLTDLEVLATSTGARLVRDLLGVQPLTGVGWPAGGVLDEPTLADLTALQTRAVLLEPRGIAPPAPPGNVVGLTGVPNPGDSGERGGSTGAGGSSGAGGEVTATGLLIDPLLARALDPPVMDEEPFAAQDGIGALVYRATADPDPQLVLLAPPRRWQVDGVAAAELLHTARGLVEAGFFAPRELTALADTHPSGPGRTVVYPSQALATEASPALAAEVRQARDVLRDLQVATVRDATANLEPAELFDPLRLGLLRGMSSAWSGAPVRATQVTGEVRARLEELRQSVQILSPPGPYTLAASDSPLLITVSNELPVGVRVRLRVSETAGLRAAAVGVQLVPARSTRQLVIPAEVHRAGQFSVVARLSTPSGTPLGPPTTLQLRSTAFDTVTIALTAGAGAVLIMLVARRIVRRSRAAHGKPGPGEE